MTVGEVLRRANDHLTAKGSDTPRLDAVLQGELDEFTAALEADEKRRRLEAQAIA